MKRVNSIISLCCAMTFLTTTVAAAQQAPSNTYVETRKLLLKMERENSSKAFKKLFAEADVRQSDLIEAMYDPEQKVSLNAQSIIRYLADPQGLSALDQWYQYRRKHTGDYWMSPVEVLADVRFLTGDDRDLAKLVLENFCIQRKKPGGPNSSPRIRTRIPSW